MRTSTVLMLTLTVVFAMAAYSQDLTVPIPPGVTPLADIGVYRVAYQSYGGEVVEMPVSWTGHFVDPSGISYLPDERVVGRSAILLHSPWRVPPGKVWVDYRLLLPKVTPIEFTFGFAMAPDVAVPGKSDGVTFSAYLLDGGKEQELMREFWTKGEWKDYRFDLSPYAGKVITLRIQTEPGPANSPSFDYSYFGDAKITAGTVTRGRGELLRELTSAKAYRATVGESLVRLSNRSDQGATPGNLLPCRNSVRQAGETCEFTYEGDDCRIAYRYEPKTGTLDDFTAAIDGGRPFQPAAGGGVTVAVSEAGKEKLVAASGGSALSVTPDVGKRALTVRWAYDIEGQRIEVEWAFGIVGKALTVQAKCDQPWAVSFSLGHVAGAPLRRTFAIPYMPADWARGYVTYLSAEKLFACRYLDWTVSQSSRCPQGEAVYEAKTDGVRNPLFESGYVALSPSINEVLPNIPNPPSPYLKLLGPRVMLDIWGHHNGTYAGDGENLRDLKDNGVDHLAIISHVWQRYGYDVKLPDHIPADPRYGGEEGMVEFGKAANDCGYVWSLHENYIDLYPDAPSYDETACVLTATGEKSKAWFNGSVQSFGLKCNRALGYAKQNAPYIHDHYKTNAAYLDVHTCVPPWHQLDHEAGQPMAASCHAKVVNDTQLFQYERDTHGGPLFGEGANHFYWAGKCDGVEAQVAGGENHTPFVDFDLLKIHPQMVNHGMGYYERWFERGYNHVLGWDTGTLEQIDKYRAQELAYGHAGWIGASQVDNVQWVAKEHNMVHPIQRLYGAAKPTEVMYEVDGEYVTGSVALVLDARWRQRIRYDSGLTLWVNWGKEPWTVEGHELPQWGFLARGPETDVYTVVRDGKYADYAECPEFLFADARTSFSMPYVVEPVAEPRLREMKYLGDSKISLTYEWDVKRAMADDYVAFVHFVNAGSTDPVGIEFQQDHKPSKATRQWKPGETVVDGPYELTIPAGKLDAYDILVGLYSPEKGGRLTLGGLDTGGSRIMVGRLKLEQQDGRITNVSLGNYSDVQKRQVGRADFTVRFSPPGTMAEFGKIATDGSAKVERGEQSLTVFPYPRDKEFTVALDLKAIAPKAKIDPAKVRVRALAAGTQADLGAVATTVEKGRLVLKVGLKGAGRYVVTW
jgi:Family of unknown function (DUF5696)